MRQLTSEEARLLTRARGLLDDLSKAADADVMTVAQAARVEAPQSPWDGYKLGLIHERCDQAERAIFEALNVLGHFGDDPEAMRILLGQREASGVGTVEGVGVDAD